MPTERGGAKPAVALAEVRTPEQFVAAMRQRKVLSGLSYLELERRADAVGDELSPEAALVGVDGLPSERLVAAFVRACGGSTDEVASWVAVHRRISVMVAEEPAAPPPARPGSAARTWLVDLLPPVFVHARRPVRVAAVSVAALLLVMVAAVWVTSGPYEEYGVFPVAGPEENGDEEPDTPAMSPESAVRKKPKQKPKPSTPPATTAAPTPSPEETDPDEYYPYPPDDGRYRYPSPTEESPTDEWPGDGDDGGGTYCEPYPSPVCRHG